MMARFRDLAAALSTSVCIVALATPAQAQDRNFNVPAGSLRDALDAYVAQSGTQLIYRPEDLGNAKSRGVSGSMSARDALDRVLAGSGFKAMADQSGALAVVSTVGSASVAVTAAGNDAASLGEESAAGAAEPNGGASGQTIVVTGTHIRGVARIPAPTTSVTREEIERSGFGTLTDVFEVLPQNHPSFSVSGSVATGGPQLANSNLEEGASGIDLRGLGPQATLVLVDGRRRAANLFGQVVDISSIPLTAVDRIDVVTGGASAIYGSDAVAGVVNVVLRRSFDGAQSRLYLGTAQDGAERVQASQTFGINRQRAGFIATYDFSHEEELDLVKTGLIVNPSISGTVTHAFDVIPSRTVHSFLASGHIDPSDGVSLFGAVSYTDNRNKHRLDYTITGCCDINIDYANKSRVFDASLGAEIDLGSAWSATISGVHSQVHNDASIDTQSGSSPSTTDERGSRSAIDSLSGIANGRINVGAFSFATALGGELRREGLKLRSVGFTNRGVNTDRTVTSLFGEVRLPFIGPNEAGGTDRLVVTAAARYDHYSDFGSTFNPQAGFYWRIGDLSLRGSYARAFRAPPLYALSQEVIAVVQRRPDPNAPSGRSPVMTVTGGNPDLKPETANTWSAGIDYDPSFLPNTRISASYFSIDFKNRIDNSALGLDAVFVLSRAEFASLLNRSPGISDIESVLGSADLFQNVTGIPFDSCPAFGTCSPTASALAAAYPGLSIFDNRLNNLASERVRGLDFSFDSRPRISIGQLTLGLRASYTFSHTRRVTPQSATIDQINEVGKPADFRFRSTLGLTTGPFDFFAFANYVDAYRNPYSTPPSRIASWTTFDVSAGINGNRLERGNPLHGWRATFAIENLFNNDPPAFLQNAQGQKYDSANANPLGRYFSLTLVKDW